MTRAIVSPSNEGSPVDGRLIRTFAAAPRAAASPSMAATSTSLAAFGLLLPASTSAAPTRSRQASRHSSGTSDARLAAVRIAVDRASISASVSRGSFSAAAKPAYAWASSSAMVRNRSDRRRPVSSAHASIGSWSTYLGRPVVSEATIVTRLAASPAATAEALPPPGTGSEDASRDANSSIVRSRNRPSGPLGCTARL